MSAIGMTTEYVDTSTNQGWYLGNLLTGSLTVSSVDDLSYYPETGITIDVAAQFDSDAKTVLFRVSSSVAQEVTFGVDLTLSNGETRYYEGIIMFRARQA